MVFALVALDPHVDDGEAVQAAGRHGLGDAALDGGDVVARDRPADDRVDELAALATCRGADPQLRDGVLPVPARLLLDLALDVGRSRDRLPERDPDRLGLDVHAELSREPFERDGDVRVADPAQHGLCVLPRPLDDERRVLAAKSLQRTRELVVVGLGTGLEGERVGRGPRDRADDVHGGGPPRECRPRWARRELRDRGDVAGDDAVDRQVVLAAQVEQPVQAFLRLGRGVDEPVFVGDRAREHLEQRHLPDERVDHGAEHVRERVGSGVGRHGDHLGPQDDRRGAVRGRRPDHAQEVGEPVDPDAGHGGADQDGEHA